MRMGARHTAWWLTLLLAASGCAGGSCPDTTSVPATEASAGASHGHGHETHVRGHRFDHPEKWADEWDDPSRDTWQKPVVVMRELELTPDASVADVGAGTGYFATRLARKVPEGRVWAVDVEPSMVRYLRERATREQIDNIFPVLGRFDDPLIPEQVQGVLVVDTYHHIEDRVAWLGTLAGYLDDFAKLVIVDFKEGDMPVGPPPSMRIPPDQVKRELTAAGYTVVTDDRSSLPYQYLIAAERGER